MGDGMCAVGLKTWPLCATNPACYSIAVSDCSGRYR